MAALKRCNERTEERPPETIDGTFANLVKRYKEAPEFTELREKTQRDYAALLRRLEGILGPFPIADIDREVVYAIRDRFQETPHQANYLLRVLRLVLGWAADRELLPANPAARPRQLTVRPRHQVWSAEAEQAFLAHAGPEMRLAYLVHAFTAQRQGDVLNMTWAQYQRGIIRLRQRKTGALVEVPAHATLRAALDAAPRCSTHILTDAKGLPWDADAFRKEWRRVTLAAGLDGLQNRDLRRTAMVRLAEAGATAIEIAAVSGHDIETTQAILETYIPRNGRMAAAAVRRLERADTRSKPKT
ncbi:tyrosine-type recombinase/integrase [Roseomonas sp. KE0001]|uniref:tyrosine-type recombinase/integrase n=1 Tax=Roseomonas sp. KE0001 TaxID=2479201 RepID=UPI0018DF17DF|nr:tyrosine-type recombinase/integrase [Roseomonas sp. KE0001]MBI0432806.1 integrase [Roseomonas sp. KE0001]